MRSRAALLASAAAALVAAVPGARADGPRHRVEPIAAADGVRLLLHRYGAVDEPSVAPRLLLLPEVGCTWRLYDFAGIGIAPWLAVHGVQVDVLEWRGSGGSEVPLGGFGLEDLALDAEVALARAAADGRPVVVGGLGLGGSLALLLAARHPEQVAGFVSLQAAATLEVPNEPVARALDSLPAQPWVDLAALARRPLLGARSGFELLLANDGTIGADERERFARYLVARAPLRLVADVRAAMRARQLAVGGRPLREVAGAWRGPSLLVFAPRDNWIHPEFSTPLRDWLGGPVRVVVLNPLEGARRDYGHLGMVLGVGAARDVYEPVLRFLREGAP